MPARALTAPVAAPAVVPEPAATAGKQSSDRAPAAPAENATLATGAPGLASSVGWPISWRSTSMVMMLGGLLLVGAQLVLSLSRPPDVQALAALDQNARLHPRLQAWRRPVYRKSVASGRREHPGSSEETRAPSDISVSDHGSDHGQRPLASRLDGEDRDQSGGVLSQGLW
uniref:Uncharacterized protein n=1 Tax=Alexandrium catenella TaxID=2925 RepID=A0A7S1QMC1_ALECA